MHVFLSHFTPQRLQLSDAHGVKELQEDNGERELEQKESVRGWEVECGESVLVE